MFEYKTERPDRPALALQLATNLVYAQIYAGSGRQGAEPLARETLIIAGAFLAWLDNQDAEEPEE